MDSRLSALREAILPAHTRYAWRHHSFGSSANNHLLGELAGLIVATVRWPALERWGASLDALQGQWEREVLAQFAEDGGNKEQALNYHRFSWELCWQARAALLAAGRRISPHVEQRLGLAAEFFGAVQVERDAWDYGDSDDGLVTPFFAQDATATTEWWNWMRGLVGGAAVGFWCGEPPVWPVRAKELAETRGVLFFRESGIYFARLNLWTVRWDLSPLGYLATAAHGHLDALHVSIWFKGVAIIVDPGTGAYYGDAKLRSWLASRAAHNGPFLDGVDAPKRLGPFLWSEHHRAPSLAADFSDPGDLDASASVPMGGSQIRRSLSCSEDESEWQVEDSCVAANGGGAGFSVRWQFAPGSWVKQQSERKFSVHRAEVVVEVEVEGHWAAVELVEPVAAEDKSATSRAVPESMEGIVSPSFRTVCRAPFLKLTARASEKPRVLRTVFRVPAACDAGGSGRAVAPGGSKK
jgi:hypothetical protein